MEEIPYLSDLDLSEQLLRILRLKNEAAKKRMKFYRLRKEQNNRFISEGEKFESENRVLFEIIHIDSIFTVIQSIESFHGVLSSAKLLTDTKNSNLEEIITSLINPKPKRLKDTRELLGKEDTYYRELYGYFAIPNLEDIPEPLSSEIISLLQPTLKLLTIMTKWSQKYWKSFKNMRNVFAHNYRFVFFDRFRDFKQKKYLESIVGFLDDKSKLIIEPIYLGPIQRVAMLELSMQLAQIEQWIYQNMRDFINKGYKPCLPLGLRYNSKKEKMKYLSIRQEQEVVKEWQSAPIKIPLVTKSQLELHESFIEANREATGRILIEMERKSTEQE